MKFIFILLHQRAAVMHVVFPALHTYTIQFGALSEEDSLELSAGADPGGRGARAPYFWQSQFYFITLHAMSEKIFLKLNFDFIVAQIRGVFGSVGCIMRVCVCDPIGPQISRFLSNIGGFRNRGRYCFFLLQRPNFE